MAENTSLVTLSAQLVSSVLPEKLKIILRRTRFYRIVGGYVLSVRERLFDLKHGVDTTGIVHLDKLDIESSNVQFGLYYEGLDPKLFDLIFKPLEFRHEDFVFVDFGSGKGRVLLMASEYPFKQVFGVEFSPELHEIAEKNIRRYKSTSQKCRDVRSLCIDAINYPIPKEPVFLFFCNPFNDEVLAPVLANIQKSAIDYPRDVYLLYVKFHHLLEKNDAFVKIHSNQWHCLYKVSTRRLPGS